MCDEEYGVFGPEWARGLWEVECEEDRGTSESELSGEDAKGMEESGKGVKTRVEADLRG